MKVKKCILLAVSSDGRKYVFSAEMRVVKIYRKVDARRNLECIWRAFLLYLPTVPARVDFY